MNPSTTGIIDAVLALALFFLAYRCFQTWKRQNSVIPQMLMFMALTYAIHFTEVAILGIFFAQHQKALLLADIGGAFWQSLAAAVGGYLVFYIFLPKSSPKIGALIFLITGLITAAITYLVPTTPFIEPVWQTIIWNHSQLEGLPRSILLVGTLFPVLYITSRQFKNPQTSLNKIKQVGVGLIFLFGILASIFDFILEKSLNLPAILGEIFLLLTAINIIVLLSILTFLEKKSS